MPLTKTELIFLERHGLKAEDVCIADHLKKMKDRQKLAKANGQLAFLGNPCKEAQHRLRWRSGHCAVCNPQNPGFQRRYHLDGYVYVAGSIDALVFKVGGCEDVEKRIRQLNSTSYGSFSDWDLLLFVKAKDYGAVERKVQTALVGHAFMLQYLKDDDLQWGQETFRCAIADIVRAMTTAIEGRDCGKIVTSESLSHPAYDLIQYQ